MLEKNRRKTFAKASWTFPSQVARLYETINERFSIYLYIVFSKNTYTMSHILFDLILLYSHMGGSIASVLHFYCYYSFVYWELLLCLHVNVCFMWVMINKRKQIKISKQFPRWFNALLKINKKIIITEPKNLFKAKIYIYVLRTSLCR